MTESTRRVRLAASVTLDVAQAPDVAVKSKLTDMPRPATLRLIRSVFVVLVLAMNVVGCDDDLKWGPKEKAAYEDAARKRDAEQARRESAAQATEDARRAAIRAQAPDERARVAVETLTAMSPISKNAILTAHEYTDGFSETDKKRSVVRRALSLLAKREKAYAEAHRPPVQRDADCEIVAGRMIARWNACGFDVPYRQDHVEKLCSTIDTETIRGAAASSCDLISATIGAAMREQ